MPRSRTARQLVRRLALSYVLLTALLYALLHRGSNLANSIVDEEFWTARSILWVIAHPDDECMFFTPSIAALAPAGDPSRKAHLLSLSQGNDEGLGETRALELVASCAVFGIPAARCHSIDDPRLPDSMTVQWPREVIAAHVARYVEEHSIDLIVTFDSDGVSDHANHKALYHALSEAQPGAPVYALRTTGLVPKYSSLLSLPLAFLRLVASRRAHSDRHHQQGLFISDWQAYKVARRSFDVHASQHRWFRAIFTRASSYMWINELERV